MIDWNHDGKYDWKDDSFFHNVVMKDLEKEDESKSNSSYSDSSISSSNGLTWFIVLCVVYFIIKLTA